MKKIVTLLFAVTLTSALVFVGCQRSGGATTASSSGGSAAPTASSAPVKLTVEIFDRGTDGGKTDPTNNKWTQWIHDKLLQDENIDVTFVGVPRWTETDALVNLFAAGTPPDVCYTYSTDNIQMWADMGGIYNVQPYINTTLKDLNAFLGPDKAIPGKQMIERNSDMKTGAIYSIPSKRMNVARTIMWIRKDWLDILGIPVPKTTQEYYDALVAFRDNAATLGVSRVIPFITDGSRLDWGPGVIMDSFIDVNISDKERWINSVADRNFLIPGYKEGVRFLNKMYNDGLIDPNFPLYKSGEDVSPVIKSGVVGSWAGDWDTIYREPNGTLSGLRANIPTADVIPVDCITDANGVTTKTIYDEAGLFYFIPVSAKDPDAAMRYLNWLSKYENYHFIQTGLEGITHTIDADGVIKLDASAAADPTWIMNSSQNIDYTMPMNGLFLGTQEESIRALSAGYSYSADIIQHAYNIALNNGRPSLVVKPTSPLTAAGPLIQTLTDKASVMYTQLIICQPAQFDTQWTSLINDWLASGAQTVVDERRAKYPD
ncbi:MAG: extracellular solute-binding protein [Treponema sp.]|jgi:putative aldouronate transport system substrate-binding protein|nr:extracellular solute-binding protein [Treponema sp.]